MEAKKENGTDPIFYHGVLIYYLQNLVFGGVELYQHQIN